MRYFLLICMLLLASCKPDGTETGNPQNSPVEWLENSKAYRVVKSACEKVVDCHGEGELDVCLSAQLTKVPYGIKFGLPGENQNWTLSKIVAEEYFGQLVGDEASAMACILQIESLVCSESSVQQGYDVNLENPYQHLAEVLPSDCQKVFNP